MIGFLLIGEIQQKIMIRFRIVDDFKTYIKAIDVDFDSEDVFLHDGCMN